MLGVLGSQHQEDIRGRAVDQRVRLQDRAAVNIGSPDGRDIDVTIGVQRDLQRMPVIRGFVLWISLLLLGFFRLGSVRGIFFRGRRIITVFRINGRCRFGLFLNFLILRLRLVLGHGGINGRRHVFRFVLFRGIRYCRLSCDF